MIYIVIGINGEYTDQHGQGHSIVTDHGLSYSATKAGSLSWVARGATDLIIGNDGVDKKDAFWDLKNTISADENLAATLTSNVVLNPSNINGLSVAPETNGTCANGDQIAGGASCGYKVSYGPTAVLQPSTDVVLSAAYTIGGYAKTTDSNKFQVQSTQTKIEINATVTETVLPTGITGDGSNNTPWDFTALSNNTLTLEYRFTNNSNQTVKFNADVGNLPSGSKVTGGDCPTGIVEGDLNPLADCTVIVDIPDPKIFNTPNLTSNSLNGAKLELSMPYSYKVNGKLTRDDGAAILRYAQFNRVWGSVNQTAIEQTADQNKYVFKVTTDVQYQNGTPGVSKPITVSPYLANAINGIELENCTISGAATSCDSTIKLPKDKFISGSVLNLSFKVKGDTMADKDAIVTTLPLTVGGGSVTPRQSHWLQISKSEDTLCVLNNDGEVYCMGNNEVGQLGNGTTSARVSTPTKVISGGTKTGKFSWIGTNHFMSCGVSDGAEYCWGDNRKGILGADIPDVDQSIAHGTGPTNGFNFVAAPSKVNFRSQTMLVNTDVNPVIATAMSAQGACAVIGNNVTGVQSGFSNVFCWGENDATDNIFYPYTSPLTAANALPLNDTNQITGVIGFSGVGGSMCVIDGSNGQQYCWGNIDDRFMATGGTRVPTSVSGAYNTLNAAAYVSQQGDIPSFSKIVKYYSNAHILCEQDDDSEFYCHGRNTMKAIPTDQNTPKKLSKGHKFTSMSSGVWNAICGLADDKQIYCWGKNTNGEFGNGTTSTTGVDTPVKVTLPPGVTGWTQIGGGEVDNSYRTGYNCAVADTDEIYCWGKSEGVFGDTVAHSLPVKMTGFK